MRRLWVALVLVACGGAPSAGTPTVAVVQIQTTSNPQPVALPAHTLWNGRYECAQGITGLSVTLDLDGGERASAVFDFGPLPENPNVPSGRYLMAGSFFQSANGTEVHLVPDRWIAQPLGYVMVGLNVTIDPSARAMQGNVTHPTCTVASLTRVQ